MITDLHEEIYKLLEIFKYKLLDKETLENIKSSIKNLFDSKNGDLYSDLISFRIENDYGNINIIPNSHDLSKGNTKRNIGFEEKVTESQDSVQESYTN